MSISATSYTTLTASSEETGRETGEQLKRGMVQPPKVVLTYLTINHDSTAYLSGLRATLGSDVPVLGCSVQGVIGRGRIREDGFAAGAMALGGDSLSASHGLVEEIASDTLAKGRALGKQLRAGQAKPLSVVVLHYDPMSRVDIEVFLEGLFSEVECPVVGGAAAHSWNFAELQRTHQYYGPRTLSRAAVAFGLSGDFTVEVDSCHGCSPVGVELTVTAAMNNVLLTLNDRPATEVWSEICGGANQSAALAIGVPTLSPSGEQGFQVRSAYALDANSGSVVIGSSIPVGTKIMLHHRSVDDVLLGAKQMGQRLAARLASRSPRATLAFECGARTRPFLGDDTTLQENLSLQREVAGNGAWLGMMPWGEIYPIARRPTFHNYCYVLLVLAD